MVAPASPARVAFEEILLKDLSAYEEAVPRSRGGRCYQRSRSFPRRHPSDLGFRSVLVHLCVATETFYKVTLMP
jgi:hypothetical protein